MDTPALASADYPGPNPQTLPTRVVAWHDSNESPGATRADLADMQANFLDAIAILEARLTDLHALVEALVTSAEQASAMAASVMQGGLRSLLAGQKP